MPIYLSDKYDKSITFQVMNHLQIKKTVSIILCFLVPIIGLCQNILVPNIPKALYTRQAPGYNYDSILFNIYIKNHSIQLSSILGVQSIDNFAQIDDYYCNVVKYKSSRSSNFANDPYNILLFIDSTTSFTKVDELFEELRTLEHEKIFLSTNVYHKQNRGIYINLSINPDSRQSIALSLYGNNYHKRKYMYHCISINKKNDLPPPPPLVPEDPDPLDLYLELKKKGADSNFYFIEIDKGRPIVNQRLCDVDYISELILNRDSKLFLKLTSKNIYNDLIKLIDVLHIGQEIAYKKASMRIFNKKINNLTYDELDEVCRKHQLYFKILSLSDQIYLEKNK